MRGDSSVMWRLQVPRGAAVSVVAGPARGRGTCLKREQNGIGSRRRVGAGGASEQEARRSRGGRSEQGARAIVA